MKRKNSDKIAIYTIFLFLYGIYCYLSKNENPQLLNWLGIFVYIYAVVTWKLKYCTNLFTPYTIFFSFFFLFNYGQCLMWAFNIHVPNELGETRLWNVSFTPTKAQLQDTQWYTCLAMFLFHCGALLNSDKKLQIGKNDKSQLCQTNMKKVAGRLLFIIVPIALYFQFRNMIIAQTFGYGALYYGAHSTQGGYMQILMYLFMPSLLCYLIGCGYSPKSRKIVYTIFGIYLLLGLLSGDRGSWLCPLIALIWLHTHYTGVSKTKMIKYGLWGLLGLYLLSAITAIRNDGLHLSADIFINAFNPENNVLVDTCFELGGSMSVITYLLNTPNDIYPYTNTYIVAIFGALSSRLLSLFGLKQVLIADWFSQEHLGLENWGVGFSMLGEAYVNGGFLGGLIYMTILGFLIGKVIKLISIQDAHRNPLTFFIGISSLSVLMYFPRAASYLVIKEFVYGILLISLIVYFMNKQQFRKKQNPCGDIRERVSV